MSASAQAARACPLLVGAQGQVVLHSLLGWLQELRIRPGSSLLLVSAHDSHSLHSGVGPENFPPELFLSSGGFFSLVRFGSV